MSPGPHSVCISLTMDIPTCNSLPQYRPFVIHSLSTNTYNIMYSGLNFVLQYFIHSPLYVCIQEYSSTPELVAVVDKWKQHRTEARRYLKAMFNPRFGSVFRTEKSPTYFSLRLSTFANLYMASLDNLMNYSLDYTFIPRRTALPHEPDLNFDVDLKLSNHNV